ncbi:hypothetical protein V2J09_016105 [Rumex salicifolius]
MEMVRNYFSKDQGIDQEAMQAGSSQNRAQIGDGLLRGGDCLTDVPRQTNRQQTHLSQEFLAEGGDQNFVGSTEFRPNYNPLPKIDFPTFDGSNPRSWIRCCERYFTIFLIPKPHKFELVSMYVTRKADVWLQGAMLQNPFTSWAALKTAILDCLKGTKRVENYNNWYQSQNMKFLSLAAAGEGSADTARNAKNVVRGETRIDQEGRLGRDAGEDSGTYQRLKVLFFWPYMKKDVGVFIQSCDSCQCNKSEHVRSSSLLQPLPLPSTAWSCISLDFIEALPKSKGYDTILVVVDRLSKYAHFIPLKHPFTAITIAAAFMDNVFKLHGLPLSIVSDRDKIFSSHLWKELFKAVGTRLDIRSAHHPQFDGQTERLN